jgi:lysozyme family protein
MSEAFKSAWNRTHSAEGGYSNNADDPGGETNHGITIKVARANGYLGQMRDLPAAKALEIAKAQYWDRLKLDQVASLSEPIAQELFDTNFNCWDGAAATFLQRSLNALNRGDKDFAGVSVDGRIGLGTIQGLRDYLKFRGKQGETVLLRCLNSLQCADYVRQVEEQVRKETFFFGWVLNRVVI